MKPVMISNEEYHKLPSVSKSQLDLFSVDQYGIEWQRNCPQDQEKIKTFDFGDAMHAICLEPDRLITDFAVMPAFNGRTNAGKAEKAEWLEEHEGFKILTDPDYKKLNLMFESVMAHPQARKLIEAEGIPESSWFWTDDDTGIDCRCRPDKLIDNLLVDVKTTPDLKTFGYSADDYRYYVQDPFYCDGLIKNGIDDTNMEFLVIQKTIEIGRYPVAVYKLPQEAIDYGRLMYKQDLENYKRYLDGHREPTKELEMSYRFIDNAMDLTNEVKI